MLVLGARWKKGGPNLDLADPWELEEFAAAFPRNVESAREECEGTRTVRVKWAIRCRLCLPIHAGYPFIEGRV